MMTSTAETAAAVAYASVFLALLSRRQTRVAAARGGDLGKVLTVILAAAELTGDSADEDALMKSGGFKRGEFRLLRNIRQRLAH
jgi:hypothetical protein